MIDRQAKVIAIGLTILGLLAVLGLVTAINESDLKRPRAPIETRQ